MMKVAIVATTSRERPALCDSARELGVPALLPFDRGDGIRYQKPAGPIEV